MIRYWILIVLLITRSLSAERFYLYPCDPTPHFFEKKDALFNLDNRECKYFALRDALRSKGHDLIATDLKNALPTNAKLIVVNRPGDRAALSNFFKIPSNRKILIILEPPVVAPQCYEENYHNHFEKVFIMVDDYVDNKKYMKLFYPQPPLEYIKNPLSFNQKKLCTMISGNKIIQHPLELYTARMRTIEFFEKNALNDFDLYGFGWGSRNYKVYKGSIRSKIDILNNYRFCICYENTRNIKGYITEKIFDAMKAGCVPVYWGAPNIAQYISAQCFIDRQLFASDQDLYTYLKTMNEETFEHYRTAIQDYLVSPESHCFTADYFAKEIMATLLALK